LNNMGVIHRIEGRLGNAAEMLERAREAFGEAGERSHEAQTLGNLAPLYKKQGNVDKAKETYREAADIFQELGDHDRQGEILMAMGLLLFETGQRSVGLSAYESGLNLVSNPTGQQKRVKTMLALRKRLQGG